MVTTPLERSWRGGQPEASRRCGTENTYVVIDTTKEMDATMFTIQANIYAKHEGQVRLYSLNMPIVDSGVDDITNSMHHLATTTSQEDEIVANAGRIVVVHSA
mmetsp:Transcript_53306/g.126851  ORF Transcript_53306/g.126851 Transcript_53306/m.126851 type:complete len:103 (+) Transcript_53306:482-790(+)